MTRRVALNHNSRDALFSSDPPLKPALVLFGFSRKYVGSLPDILPMYYMRSPTNPDDNGTVFHWHRYCTNTCKWQAERH